jgi:LysR family hydrogen peroxide-inducible transcriptional activator
MHLQQVRYFCAVARTGSFTRAAEEEGIAQPSLSQQIARLEAALDAPLFERLGRSVQLTDCGRAMLPKALEILRLLNEARAAVETARSGISGSIRLGCIPTITPYFLAPRIGEFASQFPEVGIHLIEDVTTRLLEKLQAGSLDFAIAALPVSNRDLVCSELFREPILVGVGPGHRLAGLPQVDLAALRNERILLLKEGHCFRDDALTLCNRVRPELGSIFETDQFASVFALIAAGFGISFVPAMAAAGASNCNFLPLSKEAVRRIGYIRLKRHAATPAQKTFLAWLRSVAISRNRSARPHSGLPLS